MTDVPTCTCVTRPMPGLAAGFRQVQVYDPFCQVQAHKLLGSCAEPPPYPTKPSR